MPACLLQYCMTNVHCLIYYLNGQSDCVSCRFSTLTECWPRAPYHRIWWFRKVPSNRWKTTQSSEHSTTTPVWVFFLNVFYFVLSTSNFHWEFILPIHFKVPNCLFSAINIHWKKWHCLGIFNNFYSPIVTFWKVNGVYRFSAQLRISFNTFIEEWRQMPGPDIKPVHEFMPRPVPVLWIMQ